MIKCCQYCTPPERRPGCHSTCEDYLHERKKHERDKRNEDFQRRAKRDCDDYEIKNVMKANKKRRSR